MPRTDAGAGYFDGQDISEAQQYLFDRSNFNVSLTTVQRILKKQAQALPPLKGTIELGKTDNTLETDGAFIFYNLKNQ